MRAKVIELGHRVRDTLTGFEGVATSRHEYLFDQPSWGVQADAMHDGKPLDSVHFSAARLVSLGRPSGSKRAAKKRAGKKRGRRKSKRA